MNDCKITTEFARLESRKRSYSNIFKLILPHKDKHKDQKVITQPIEIRKKMAKHFQQIFNKQKIDNNPNCIAAFLVEDNYSKPYENLLCRQLSGELKQELEGFTL